MARARNIKPGFFRNADLVELSFEARLLFIGLWTIADRDGRLEDRPKQIKMELFPADNMDCDVLLSQLESINMIERYSHGGARVIQVVNFSKHQNPHRDEKASTLPDRDGNTAKPKDAHEKHRASTVQAPCTEDAGSVAIGLNPDPLILNPDPGSLKPEVTASASRARASRKPAADAAVSLSVSDLAAEGVDPQHAADWFKSRKDKGAKTLTPTAWNAVKVEAAKAGMTPAEAVKTAAEQQWQGFKASWLSQPSRASPPFAVNKQEALEARNKAVAEEWLREQGVSDAGIGQGEILDVGH